MIGWIILGVYVVGYVATWRTIVWAMLSDGGKDGEDVVFSVVFGSLADLVWPPIVIALVIRAICHARGKDARLVVAPRHKRRELELQEREHRIAQMERDLGVGR